MIRLFAGKGGVISANAFPSFLPKGFNSTISDHVDAIEDLVDRVGVDHVGIGTNLPRIDQINGWMSCSTSRGPNQRNDLNLIPTPYTIRLD